MYTGPDIVTDGLIYDIDPGSERSYSGSGSSVNNLVGTPNATFVNTPGFSSSNGGIWEFDGVDDYAELGTVDLTGGFTLQSKAGGGLAAATAKLKAQGLKKGGSPKKKKKFPDLSGDGKVTMKDILMARGVIKKKTKKKGKKK